jgi:hypothetical protein
MDQTSRQRRVRGRFFSERIAIQEVPGQCADLAESGRMQRALPQCAAAIFGIAERRQVVRNCVKLGRSHDSSQQRARETPGFLVEAVDHQVLGLAGLISDNHLMNELQGPDRRNLRFADQDDVVGRFEYLKVEIIIGAGKVKHEHIAKRLQTFDELEDIVPWTAVRIGLRPRAAPTDLQRFCHQQTVDGRRI